MYAYSFITSFIYFGRWRDDELGIIVRDWLVLIGLI
ncbi:MAG: hypothetical protein SCAL_000656 [Candidatus Syntrophoarchaeum caldarius]|uniref:Uncharacterized protein n=1 Tax=Candidatus Syntropharchaeum caldarium TaxID=1838285 RepID=A0A1F2PBK2_9EURY|nr:MAG: hypothetical protein SCAL_000656 [Candidatus Syntrophoarchaeum caldarius]